MDVILSYKMETTRINNHSSQCNLRRMVRSTKRTQNVGRLDISSRLFVVSMQFTVRITVHLEQVLSSNTRQK